MLYEELTDEGIRLIEAQNSRDVPDVAEVSQEPGEVVGDGDQQ